VGSAYREGFLSPPFGGSLLWKPVDPGLASRRPGLHSAAPAGLAGAEMRSPVWLVIPGRRSAAPTHKFKGHGPLVGHDMTFDLMSGIFRALPSGETFLSPPFGGSLLWDAVDPGLAPRRPGLHSAAPAGLAGAEMRSPVWLVIPGRRSAAPTHKFKGHGPLVGCDISVARHGGLVVGGCRPPRACFASSWATFCRLLRRLRAR